MIIKILTLSEIKKLPADWNNKPIVYEVGERYYNLCIKLGFSGIELNNKFYIEPFDSPFGLLANDVM
jgi:hypothetical protein